MSTPALLFLCALVLPFFKATWRTTLASLSIQGFVLGSIVLERRAHGGAAVFLPLCDAFAVRGVLVPWMLYRVMQEKNASARAGVVPPNMLSWTIVGALIAVSFRFAGRMSPGSAGQAETAVAAGAVLLGLFSLATQTSVFNQAAGALCIENGIAFFELRGAHGVPFPLGLGMAAGFLLSACMFALYVRWLEPLPDADILPAPPLR